MIIGHATNTFALYVLGRRSAPRWFSAPAFFTGVWLPDLLDKPPMVFMEWYPGRGIFHSVITLSLALYIFSRIAPDKGNLWLSAYAGSVLHLIQDGLHANNLLWPFMGTWTFYPPASLPDKVKLLYFDMQPYSVWAAEIASLSFCVAYLIITWLSGRAWWRDGYALKAPEEAPANAPE